MFYKPQLCIIVWYHFHKWPYMPKWILLVFMSYFFLVGLCPEFQTMHTEILVFISFFCTVIVAKCSDGCAGVFAFYYSSFPFPWTVFLANLSKKRGVVEQVMSLQRIEGRRLKTFLREALRCCRRRLYDVLGESLRCCRRVFKMLYERL